MKTRILLTLGVVLTAVSAMAGAGFAYQGVLQDSAGSPQAHLVKNVTFRLYETASGGSPLWGRMASVGTDADGMFVVELNDSLPAAGGLQTQLDAVFEATLKNDKALFVGLTVENGAEIAPRQKLLTTPVASIAKTLRKASGNFTVRGSARFSGALTIGGTAKMAGPFVAEKGDFKKNVKFDADVRVTGSARGTLPVGSIVMWAKNPATIPRGWALCDGKKVETSKGVYYQTPDLSNRFTMMAWRKEHWWPGETGGDETVTLTIDQMPRHTHDFLGDAPTNGNPFTRLRPYNGSSDGFDYKDDLNIEGYWSIDPGENERGGGKAHNNIPPYKAINFIIRVK